MAKNRAVRNSIVENKTKHSHMAQNKTDHRYDVQPYILRGLRLLGLSVMALMIGSLIGLNSLGNAVFYKIENQKIIVLDAGHGGFDSGKVGVNGSLEKELNLQIAEKCKKYLEQSGYKVVMTREDDNGLYDVSSKNKKREDMNARVNIMNTSDAMLAVSIHQNSYTGAACSGAQVFYYNGSEAGKQLAGYIQDSIIVRVQPQNTRQIKANSDYFILKHTKVPTAIVECGFLSNADEERKLCDDTYQEKLAWAITMGIVQYCSQAGSL